MNELSHAQQARKYDPWAMSLNIVHAEEFWKTGNFIGTTEVIRASQVIKKNGILSVIFADGSIINY